MTKAYGPGLLIRDGWQMGTRTEEAEDVIILPQKRLNFRDGH